MDRCNLVGMARAMRLLSINIVKTDKQETLQSLVSAGIELSHGQYLVCRYLSESALTLTKLSHALNLDPSTLVPIVDSMVQRGLVQRSRNPEDRRCTHLARSRALVSRPGCADVGGLGPDRVVQPRDLHAPESDQAGPDRDRGAVQRGQAVRRRRTACPRR